MTLVVQLEPHTVKMYLYVHKEDLGSRSSKVVALLPELAQPEHWEPSKQHKPYVGDCSKT